MNIIPQHILLVDDRQTERETLPQLFEYGRVWNPVHTVAGQTELQEYLDDVTRPTPDILLIDLRLVDGTGVGCIRLANTHPRTAHKSAIIAISATVSDTDRVEAEAAGADGIIEKPITADVLLAALKQINGFGWQVVRRKHGEHDDTYAPAYPSH